MEDLLGCSLAIMRTYRKNIQREPAIVCYVITERRSSPEIFSLCVAAVVLLLYSCSITDRQNIFRLCYNLCEMKI